MEISEFAFRLIMIFAPGLLAFLIFNEISVHKGTKPYEVFIGSFLLGLISYVALFIIAKIPCVGLSPTFPEMLTDMGTPIRFSEIAVAMILAMPIGLVTAALKEHKVLFRVAHWLNVSKKFGDLDVWSYTMNSPNTGWVTVRDQAENLMYQGWALAFSDGSMGEEYVELLLSNVQVFALDSGAKVADMKSLYVSRNRGTITLEVHEGGEHDGR